MKKKILFIISNMESGGVSKSMSSLLNVIDTTKYEVDCFILSPSGVFIDSIPKNINIISFKRTSILTSKFPNNIIGLLKNFYFLDTLLRVVVALLMKIDKGYAAWILSRRIERISKQYDLAVDYNGQHQLYYLVDKINAKIKVSFFHSDYKKWPFYYSKDKIYYDKVDKIYTISATCVESLQEFFPNYSNKIDLFENISSISLINNLAEKYKDNLFENSCFNIVTVGHICQSKGTGLAIQAASFLKEKGLNFKWYFIGNDNQKNKYLDLMEKYKVINEIILLGIKSNPYPYIKQANMVVHPSLFEGKSIALDEAKILCKPIVVTNFSTVNDQFTNHYNASICSFEPIEIADKIMELYADKKLCDFYVNNLKKDCKDNITEIEKLYKLMS